MSEKQDGFQAEKTVTEQVSDMHGYSRPAGAETSAVKEIHNQNFEAESHVPVATALKRSKFLGNAALIASLVTSAFGLIFDTIIANESFFLKHIGIGVTVALVISLVYIWLEIVRHDQGGLLKSKVIPFQRKSSALIIVVVITAINLYGHVSTGLIIKHWLYDLFNSNVQVDIKEPAYIALLEKKAKLELRVEKREDAIVSKNDALEKQITANTALQAPIATTVATTIHARKREANAKALENLQQKAEELEMSKINSELDSTLLSLRKQLDITQKSISAFEDERSGNNENTAYRLSIIAMVLLILLDIFALYHYLVLAQSKSSLDKGMSAMKDKLLMSSDFQGQLKRLMEQISYMDSQSASHAIENTEKSITFRQVAHSRLSDIHKRNIHQIASHNAKRVEVNIDSTALKKSSTLDINELYDFVNQQAFNGTLPTLEVKYSALKGEYGRVEYDEQSIYAVLLDNTLTEDELLPVLAHEMAHVALIISANDASHGKAFLTMVRGMEKALGISIPTGIDTQQDTREPIDLKTVHALLSSYLKLMLLLPGEAVKNITVEEKNTLVQLGIINSSDTMLIPANEALQRLYHARDSVRTS